MFKEKKIIRLLICLLTIVLFFTNVNVWGFAISDVFGGAKSLGEEPNGYNQSKYLSNYSSITSNEQIEKLGHKSRLEKYDSELNAIGYLNDDGTESVYIYSDDIKYVDSDGYIQDKDINIIQNTDLKSSSQFKYSVASNDFKCYFSDGRKDTEVKFQYGDYYVTMSPVVLKSKLDKAEKEAIVKNDVAKDTNKENYILYDQVFDESTQLKFTTTYNGVKEDIILTKYTGVNQFQFIADFGSLIPAKYNDGIRLYNSEEEAVFDIPPIFVNDSSREIADSYKFTMDNSIDFERLENGKYLLTITVDEEFLRSPDTVYPVFVDPYIRTISSASYFSDAPVYSSYPTSNFGTYLRNFIGTDATYGKAYSYVKFNLSAIEDIRYDNILSACYYAWEDTHESSVSTIDAYMVLSNWVETSITWNNKPGYINEKICKVNVCRENANELGTYRNEFYITSAVMAWRQGTPNYGLMLKEKSSSFWKGFCSREYSSYLPSLLITYTSESEVTEGLGLVNQRQYYIKNKRSELYMTNSGNFDEANVYQSTFTGNTNQKWTIEYQGNGYYYIVPANATSRVLDVYCGPTSPTGNIDTANVQLCVRGSAKSNQLWKIKRNWNGSYRMLSKMSSDVRGVTVAGASTTTNVNIYLYTYSTDYTYNDDWTFEAVNLGDIDFFAFTNEGGYGLDTTVRLAETKAIAGNINSQVYVWNNVHASTAIGYMPNDGVWYYSGHGYGDSAITFHSKSGNNWVDSYICTSGNNSGNFYHIEQLSQNGLAKVSLVAINACSAGRNDDDVNVRSNMVGMLYKRGTHMVTAHPIPIWTGTLEDWRYQFVYWLSRGYTIYQAMEKADDWIYVNHPIGTYGNLNQRHVLGDTSITLKH